MSFDVNRLYELMPAVYRIRDAELALQAEQLSGVPQDGPLKALLSVIAEQAEVLQEDLDQLYDDQFIETCAEWVVPYIGDLVGARRVFVFPGARFTERAFVANTMAYRRRKGTAAMLEQLARDVTGWNANVVEFFQLLATTQYMKTYFGVTPVESVQSGLGVYNPSGGIKGAGFEVSGRYEFTPQWALVGMAFYERLVGDAADSPIVRLGDDNQITAKLGLSYKLGLKLFND